MGREASVVFALFVANVTLASLPIRPSGANDTVHPRHSQSRAVALFVASQLPLLIRGRSLRLRSGEQILVRAQICLPAGRRVNCVLKKVQFFLKTSCIPEKYHVYYVLLWHDSNEA